MVMEEEDGEEEERMRNEEKTLPIITDLSGSVSQEVGVTLTTSKVEDDVTVIEEERTSCFADLLGNTFHTVLGEITSEQKW
jgi:hypothetical protein